MESYDKEKLYKERERERERVQQPQRKNKERPGGEGFPLGREIP